MVSAREYVLLRVTVEITLWQDQALVEWARDLLDGVVDCDEGDLSQTKLLQHLNAGEFQLAAAEFSKYCLVDGRIDQAALNRRNNEAHLFRR